MCLLISVLCDKPAVFFAAGLLRKGLINNSLNGVLWVNDLSFSVLMFVENKNVKIFAKILQKNLEIKKMSVSLQPI